MQYILENKKKPYNVKVLVKVLFEITVLQFDIEYIPFLKLVLL